MSGVVWSGMEGRGVNFSGVEWCGVKLSGMERSGVEFSGVGWSEGVEPSGGERRQMLLLHPP